LDSHSILKAFQRIWGYENFRPPQRQIIEALMAGQDLIVVMPTGGGKSICFQLPALLQAGLTLVVSPLVALMENQVAELRQKRLPAACLHSQMPRVEQTRTLAAIAQQKLRLLYLSPETLLKPTVWDSLSQPQVSITGLILDEAHCLVQWGETFRPAYRRLGMVRSALLKTKPAGTSLAIAAFTATADPQVQHTLGQVLQLERPRVFQVNPYRTNLSLQIQTVCSPRSRRQRLLQFIRAQGTTSGLIYARGRREVETLATELRQDGIHLVAYHGGLDGPKRRQIEQDWLQDRIPIVACTNAFGLGINKPQTRWVAHHQVPLLLGEYLQEVGRSGRDGQRAVALALVSEPTGWLDPTDQQRWQFFRRQLCRQYQEVQTLANRLPQTGSIRTIKQQFPKGELALSLLHSQGQLRWLDPFHYEMVKRPKIPSSSPDQAQIAQQMRRYLTTKDCRWQFILRAFGFDQAARALGQGCGHCDRCQ
jgi:ATP-dependent DNA helicase RecQ